MNKPKKMNYVFTGYAGYAAVERKIRIILDEAFGQNNPHFMIAVNEAVCNTAKHSADSEEDNAVDLKLVVTGAEVKVTVTAQTSFFDAEHYRQNLRELAKNRKHNYKEWPDYVVPKNLGMGFWYMMTGTDYLIVEHDGSSITLVKSLPYKKPQAVERRIDKLVDRFLVRHKGIIT